MLHATVIWTNSCHLLPAKTDINLLSFQALSHIGQVILDPFICQGKVVELCACPRNSLIPHDDLVLLAIISLKLADNREKDNISVPVEQI